MPLVSISTERLGKLVGRRMDRDELTKALRSLGSDVEGFAAVTRYRCSNCGQMIEALEHEDFNGTCDACGSKDLTETGTSDVVRIKLEPVRPDVFDVFGLARALRGKLGIETGLPHYEFRDSGLGVRVQAGMESIRPCIACCVARGVALDDELVKMLMKMQENLHWALGRDRRKASIGVYDLDTVKPDFEFRPVEPEGVRFVPLFGMPAEDEGGGEVRSEKLEARSQNPNSRPRPATPKEILERHPKGMAYAHLLAGMKHYPLLVDATGKVLSMPPIINSDDTRVTEKSKNLFVDVTGPDRHAVTKALCIVAASLADLGGKVETVSIRYPGNRVETTPDMMPARTRVEPANVRRVLGFELAPDEICRCLERMRHDARVAGKQVEVAVAAYRSDIMHEYDVIEDVGIGFGYENMKPRLVSDMTVAKPQPVEERSDVCRRALTGLGFLETMTLLLTSVDEHLKKLGMNDDGPYVQLQNPASIEQAIIRRHLLSGLLATFRVNTTAEMPQSIFEIGDCFELDPESATGVRAERRVSIGITGPKAGFADIKAAVESLAFEIGMELEYLPVEHPTFIAGRAAELRTRNQETKRPRNRVCGPRTPDPGARIGVLGEVHPEVLERFGLSQPTVLAELLI